MTNDKVHKHDIYRFPRCQDGYLIVRKNVKNGDIFYGVTNSYNEEQKCKIMIKLSFDPV